VHEVFLCGLATETTILNTALDALGFELKPIVIEDACRGYTNEAAGKAIEEMKAAGVLCTTSRDVLAWPVRR
jgi:nicotinamidase-related amidase